MKDKPIASVWCADCTAEGRGMYRLGLVDRTAGLLLWLPMDPRKLRGLDKRYIKTSEEWYFRTEGILELTPSSGLLPAWCKYHGEGRVAASAIYGRSGNIVAKLVKATA